jgi:hypothetical protein
MINGGGVTGQLASSSINGNGGDDTTMWLNITNTSIYGGQGDDTLGTQAGTATTNASEIQGNRGLDTINLTGSVTFSTVYGGRDADTINFITGINSFGNSIQGNKGDDTLNITITAGSDNEVYGGQDNDTIDAFGTTTAVLLSGDKGNDDIRGGTGTGAQVLDGGDGRDILVYEGNSATTMIGGEGPDVFRINAISAGAAPFIEDFNSVEDNIEINIDPGTFTTTTLFSSRIFVGTPSTGFFGATAEFGFTGLQVAGGGLGARWLQAPAVVPFNTPVAASFGQIASRLSGQLTDGNLFKAANINQLQARISAAGATTGFRAFPPFISGPAAYPLNALGFTQDSRRLFAFTNIRTTAVMTAMGSAIALTFNTVTLAQFATNNVNGSDIFLV